MAEAERGGAEELSKIAVIYISHIRMIHFSRAALSVKAALEDIIQPRVVLSVKVTLGSIIPLRSVLTLKAVGHRSQTPPPFHATWYFHLLYRYLDRQLETLRDVER